MVQDYLIANIQKREYKESRKLQANFPGVMHGQSIYVNS